MKKLHFLIHFFAYNLTWSLCIVFAAMGSAWGGPLVAVITVSIQLIWQHYYVKDTRHLLFMMSTMIMLGTLVDTLLLHSGLMIFKANPFAPLLSPPWMIALWFSFSITFYATLQFIFRYYLVLAILALPGFAFAYYVGVLLGAAIFPYGSTSAWLVGFIWAVLLPVYMYVYNRLTG